MLKYSIRLVIHYLNYGSVAVAGAMRPQAWGDRTIHILVQQRQVQRREFEYIRHGTQTLIASFNVVTGQVINPTCGDTRTEEDFAAHIQTMLEEIHPSVFVGAYPHLVDIKYSV